MARRLVVCADGTWNNREQVAGGVPCPTNVVKLYEAVSRRPTGADGTPQRAYYHDGVGVEPNTFERLWHRFATAVHLEDEGHNRLCGVTGLGIDANIKDCYRWLSREYEPGDQLYLFGFSRGAYTVRSLAGMIRNCGLLVSHEADLVDQAYELYRDRGPGTDPNSDRAARFRQLYAREVDVHCIGVWDTVGALGVPLPALQQLNARRYQFHDVTLSSHVAHAYHALAIDERRVPFAPTLWEQQPDAPPTQVLEQTWFPGVHCNVGGGYPDSGLSDLALHWMIERAGRAGLEVDEAYVAKVAATPNWRGVLENSMNRLFEIAGEYVRPIAEGRRADDLAAGRPDLRRESVHDSAFDRWGQVVDPFETPYAPPNLGDYLQRFGATRPGADQSAASGAAAGAAAGAAGSAAHA